MKKITKSRKKNSSSHLKWLSFSRVAIILLIVVIFALGIKQFLNFGNLAKSDNLVNNYRPPGAKPAPIRPQTKIVLPIGDQTVHVPILLYHYLEYNRDTRDTIRTSLAVTPFWFEKQLQYLKDNGYETISLNELYEIINKRWEMPKKPVILTFDDGYRDFYTDALPLLKKYKTKATVFVIPGFLDKPNYLFTWQLKEIATQSAGLITIGAHTMHHPALTGISLEKAYEEIVESKKYLEENFDLKTSVFNYPYGSFNKDVENLVKKSGFQVGVSTILGSTESLENIFILPRIRVGNYAGEAFEQRLKINP